MTSGRITLAAALPITILILGWLAPLRGAQQATSQPAKDKEEKPTTRDMDCLRSGCHGALVEFGYVHGPAAVGACDMCHVYDDSKEHTFRYKRPLEQLCDFCHIGRAEGEVVHEPVSQRQCLDCHNPHGAANRMMLRTDDMAKLCDTCHDSVTRGREHAHGPVATGSCEACHRSHTSEYPKLLMAEGRRVCLDCHQQMERDLTMAANVHEPAEKEPCVSCHEPHASNHSKQLTQARKDLCLSCHDHDAIKDQIAAATHSHSAVTDDPACMNCHTAHGGSFEKLLNERPLTVCLNCHDEPVLADDGTVQVASVADMARPELVKHGAVRDGNCGSCHDVHGGKVSRLLTGAYPETFYESFSPGKYELCFSCHTEQLAAMKDTRAVTEFRNGTQNLHYVHVNMDKQGRSCRACHRTHVSENPAHLRQTVSFGNWEMPINFQPTPTGGACASGCHKKLAYDRDNPVRWQVEPKPTTAPSAAQPAATTRPAIPATTTAPAPSVGRDTTEE